MAISLNAQINALSHPARVQLLGWLKAPRKHFPAQVDGDLVEDGVCAVFVTQKWKVAQPTASRHLKQLVDAGFLLATRKKGWTFYRRNEVAIVAFFKKLEASL
jgi:DNA-binding transcriptional ArsR family regulator